MTEPFANGPYVLRRAAIMPEERAVVLGAGMMALVAIQSLRAHGVTEIIVVTRSQTRGIMAKASGATTICITSHPASPVAEIVDIKLCTSAWENLVHDDSPSVRNAQLALIDVIYKGILMRAPQRAQLSLSKANEAISTLQL